MKAITAVVFDLDDTLYPERAYAMSGFEAVADRFSDVLGDPVASTAAMHRLFDSDHRPRVFNTLLQERGLEADENLIGQMVDAFRSHWPNIALHKDADAALNRLRPDYRLGLITDGPAIAQRNKIEALGLTRRLDHTIVTSEMRPPRPKPDPTAYVLMAQRLGVSGSECVYIADNAAKDFIAPNSLGWRTIQIVRPDGVYAGVTAPPGGRPQYVIDTLDAVETLWADEFP